MCSSDLKELKSVIVVNNITPAEWILKEPLARRTAIDPFERLLLTASPVDYAMRVVLDGAITALGDRHDRLVTQTPPFGRQSA